jgi:hypothetical protein
MEVPYRPSFDEERQRYRLRFTCETCAHFDAPSGECSLGFPNASHRLAHYEAEPRPAVILFCKEFECV